MGERLRAGIIGFGRIGRIRLHVMQRSDVWDVQAVADPIASSGDLPPSIKLYRDYRDLLAFDLDAVFVCTPNHVTAAAVVDALSLGRHVFCEKPPGRNLAEARSILTAANARPDLKVKCGFNHRYHDAIREAKAIVESGRLGRVLWLRGVYGKSGDVGFQTGWRSRHDLAGGGILLDQGIHMVDLFLVFVGDFDEVKSFVNNLYWDTDVEDNAFALLRNRDGQVAMLHSSATQWKHRFSLEIFMSDGYVAVNGILSSTRSYGRETLIVARRPVSSESLSLGSPREEITYFDHDNSWQLEVDEFAECILRDLPVTVGSPADAYKTMELIDRIYDADPTWHVQRTASPMRRPLPAVPDPLAARSRASRRVVVLDDLRESEIRPPDLYAEYLSISSADAQRFFQQDEFVTVPCPGCGSDRFEPGFEKDAFTYVVCVECWSLYANPRPHARALVRYYAESAAASFWRERFLPATLAARRERVFHPRAQWVGDLVLASGFDGPVTYLDIGLGYETLLDEIKRLGIFQTVVCLEFPGDVAEISRATGSRVVKGAGSDIPMRQLTPHVITAFEVLERTYDPAGLLTAAARLMAPGGLFLFTTLSISGLDLQILWNRAKNIFPPDHINLLSIEGVERLAQRTGFSVHELSTPGLLDLELLARELRSEPTGPEGRFWRYLLTRRSDMAHRDFQELLQKHRLSSHVRGVFVKRSP